MAMIFPGMDPYLENPAFWPGFHNEFLVYLRDRIQPGLGTRYVAATETRVYIEGRGRGTVPGILIRHGQPSGLRSPSGAIAVAEDEALSSSRPPRSRFPSPT